MLFNILNCNSCAAIVRNLNVFVEIEIAQEDEDYIEGAMERGQRIIFDLFSQIRTETKVLSPLKMQSTSQY